MLAATPRPASPMKLGFVARVDVVAIVIAALIFGLLAALIAGFDRI